MKAALSRKLIRKIPKGIRWSSKILIAFLFSITLLCTYFNKVGIPMVLAERLLAALNAQGIEFEAVGIKLKGLNRFQIIKAEINQQPDSKSVRIRLDEAEFSIDWFRIKGSGNVIRDLVITNAELYWPVSKRKEGPVSPLLENISLYIKFDDSNGWEWAQMQAVFLGMKLMLRTEVDNVSQLKETIQAQYGNYFDKDSEGGLKDWFSDLEAIQFSEAPEVFISLSGNAEDLSSLKTRLRIRIRDAESPIGSFEEARFMAEITPSLAIALSGSFRGLSSKWGNLESAEINSSIQIKPNEPFLSLQSFQCETSAYHSPWVETGKASLSISNEPKSKADNGDALSTLHLDLQELQTDWGHSEAAELRISAEPLGSILNGTSADFTELSGTWGRSQKLSFTGDSIFQKNPLLNKDSNEDIFQKVLSTIETDWTLSGRELAFEKLLLSQFKGNGSWSPSEFNLESIEAFLYGGILSADLNLNLQTRLLQGRVLLDFDLHGIQPLLGPPSARWLEQITWESPPEIKSRFSINLPTDSGMNAESRDWTEQALSSLQLKGSFDLGKGTFGKVPFSSLSSRFNLNDSRWELPDLIAVRPEGEFKLNLSADSSTKAFQMDMESSIDPISLHKSLKTEKQRQAMDLWEFRNPPRIKGTLRGNWQDTDSTDVRLDVVATDFSTRGIPFSSVTTQFHYTNGNYRFENVKLKRPDEFADLSLVSFHLPSKSLSISNAVSHMSIDALAHAIGPVTIKAMEPYQFDSPPDVKAGGTIHLIDRDKTRMLFEVKGAPVKWKKFQSRAIESATVFWQGKNLSISNAVTEFYGGKVTGNLFFEFRNPKEHLYQYEIKIKNAELKALNDDLQTYTNRISGKMDMNLAMTDGRVHFPEKLKGHGNIFVSDGYIWDVPLFGVLSPALNSLPGNIGNNRAKAATAAFKIRKGEIHTDNLHIHAPPLDLLYKGYFTFDGKIDARVQARMLHDRFLLGPLLKTVLSPLTLLFEYQVSGTLKDPISNPVYNLPKLFTTPFTGFSRMKNKLLRKNQNEPQ